MTKFTYKQHEDTNWYWHAKSKGRIKADGSEGYKRKGTLLRSLNRLIQDIREEKFTINEGK